MIVATAGHVDHGKTTLVRALTGVDTDRLVEEKRRGMSIDLGFAWGAVDDDGAAPVGFIDVPGHERFMRNMLAGVACIDLALLVVAADDGPMPQTVEHLAVLTLLGVPRCVVALTKIDRVDAARRHTAEGEIAALLAAGPFRDAPVCGVVATTAEGVPALRARLADARRSLVPRRVAGHFRLAVDRSFTIAGTGRIVTGAVLAGRVQAGDAVVVSPSGTAARVRALQVGHRDIDSAVAGERCALTLAGADLKDGPPVRGDWIVAPPAHAPTDRLDVRLDRLAGAARPLAQGVALQLHIGATMVAARVTLLSAGGIAEGASGFARLRLERPVAALFGDRFVLRDATAGRSVAGGSVVDPFAPSHGGPAAARVAQLEALSAHDPADALARCLATAADGLDLRRFALARNLDANGADTLARSPQVHRLDAESAPRVLSTTHWSAWQDRIRAALAQSHAAEPASLGPGEAGLAACLGLRTPTPLFHAALASLLAGGAVVRDGLRLRAAGHRAVLSVADAALLERVRAVLEPAGLRPPIVGELAAHLALPQPALLDFLQRASLLGSLVRVAPNRFFLPATVDELAARARRLSAESAGAEFGAAAYRDATGIGRNLTVQVLEFLDREGVTRTTTGSSHDRRRSWVRHPR